MIPILFESNATSFSTNGIGRLTDAISCNVVEERNGEFSLELVYLVGGQLYNEIKHSRLIVVKPNHQQERQAFRIYKISKARNGRINVLANHISYDLNDVPVLPFEATGIVNAFEAIKTNSVEDNPFIFATTSTNTSTFISTQKPKSARACLGGSENSILANFSGSSGLEYKWDNFNVFAFLHRGSNNGVQLRYGKNITDFKQEESIANTITGVLPTYTDSEHEVTIYGDVQYSQYANNYPKHKTAILDCSEEFETMPTKQELNTYAYNYVQQQGIPDVNFSLSFVELAKTDEYKDIAQLEKINLCDEVTVIFEKLGIKTTAKVVKVNWDVLKERYISVEIGRPKSNLASTLSTTITDIENTSDKMSTIAIEVDRNDGRIKTLVADVAKNTTQISSLEQTSSSIIANVTEVRNDLSQQQATFALKSDGAYISMNENDSYSKFTDKGMEIYASGNKIAEATADTFKAPSFTTENWTIREDNGVLCFYKGVFE